MGRAKLEQRVFVGVIALLAIVVIGLTAINRYNARSQAPRPTLEFGTLRISTSPAKLAVYVDDALRGKTPLHGKQPFRSAPLLINKLTPGVHQLRIEREHVEPLTREVTIHANETENLHLMLWHSDTVVEMNDGRSHSGMIVARTSGYTDLATRPNSIRRLLNADIASSHRSLQPKMKTSPEMEPRIDSKTGTPEYIFDPFPNDKLKKK
jgi:hypothetical protein